MQPSPSAALRSFRRMIRGASMWPTAAALSSAQCIHVVARWSQRASAVSHLPVTRDQISSPRPRSCFAGSIRKRPARLVAGSWLPLVVHLSSEIGGAVGARSVTRATAPRACSPAQVRRSASAFGLHRRRPTPHPSSCQSGSPRWSARRRAGASRGAGRDPHLWRHAHKMRVWLSDRVWSDTGRRRVGRQAYRMASVGGRAGASLTTRRTHAIKSRASGSSPAPSARTASGGRVL